jgi:hypothetical protein
MLKELEGLPDLVVELIALALSNAPKDQIDSRREASPQEERATDLWLARWEKGNQPIPSPEVCLALFPRLCALVAFLNSRKLYGFPPPSESYERAGVGHLLTANWPEWKRLLQSADRDRN